MSDQPVNLYSSGPPETVLPQEPAEALAALADAERADDPVGAISVHLVSGVWGTLAAGLFGEGTSFGIQLAGVAIVGVTCFAGSYALFWALKKTIGIRVSREEEQEGLDFAEHGMRAYGDL